MASVVDCCSDCHCSLDSMAFLLLSMACLPLSRACWPVSTICREYWVAVRVACCCSREKAFFGAMEGRRLNGSRFIFMDHRRDGGGYGDGKPRGNE
ncbi:hypothetical protein BC567DRAFT_215316 [Phyllosticta citribraziliensis]